MRTVAKPPEAENTALTLVKDNSPQKQIADSSANRAFWQTVVEGDPHNEQAWLTLAALAENDQQTIKCLRRVLELNPQNEQALARLHQALLNEGIMLAKQGNKARARWLLMEASALNPNNEQCWLWLAQLAEKSSDVVRCLQKVLKLNPRNEQAIKWLNQVFALQSNLAPLTHNWQCPICAAAFQMELTICPSCRAMLTLANVDGLLANREVEREVLYSAIKHYQNLTESLEDFNAWFYQGLAFLQLRRLKEGIACLQKASSLRPQDQALKNQLALLQQRQKAAAARTVLIIDDSATIRKHVTLALEKEGHRVMTAAEMMEALARLNQATPDLILLDITLPGMDGYQICKIIKAYPATKDVPVVMLTGRDGFFDKVRARLVGAQGYITKPFQPPELVKAIENHCQQAELK